MRAASVAVVRDWLTVHGGADRVMEAVLEGCPPRTPIYALVYQAEHFRGSPIAQHPVHTSFIQRLPWGSRRHRAYLPLMPLAIEQFDLEDSELVISLSHAVAKGVLTRADQLHISYVFTPMRYAWDLYFQYMREAQLHQRLAGWVARPLLHYLRIWDLASARRPDVLVAASHHVARRIRRLYGREARVVYPPVDVERFVPRLRRDEFYLIVSRLVPYKQVSLVVEAFSRLGRPLVVIGDGPDRKKIRRLAGPSVRLLGYQPDAVVTDHMERCKAFVHAANEDFGIAPVEAQAAGAPVIAYGRGGATETIVPGETGLFFARQTVDSLVDAVRAFEADSRGFEPARIRQAATRFNKARFQREFQGLVDAEWARFTQVGGDGWHGEPIPGQVPRSVADLRRLAEGSRPSSLTH